jgi:signal transduction histidine kinase
MLAGRHKRQISLFLIAVLVPAVVLIGLATRILNQDRELAAKRALDRRRAAVDQLQRELSARLEAIKLQEINRLIRASPAGHPDNPAVVFTATLEGDQLRLAGEGPAPEESAEFAKNRREGETQEFVKKDPQASAAAYRSALASARNASERAEARFLMARSLSTNGSVDEANRLYLGLLNDPSDARDSEGVGYRFYAADRLLAMKDDAKRVTSAVMSFVRNEANEEERLTLRELYMLRNLMDPNVDPRVSQRITELEQAEAMAKDIPHLRVQMENGAAWMPAGQGSNASESPWLVTLVPAAARLPGLVIAVSSAKVSPPGVKLVAHGAEGDALGEMFPGLRVQWSDSRFLEVQQGLPKGLWTAALTLVLGIALFGGYLLLRDVNRDVRVAEVRSQFVASVSHELKTPLTAIRMYAETLAMGRSRDEQTKSEYLETIVNESERLARLVDNVLDFSKIEQGKKIYRLRPTRLEDVAGSAVRAMQFPLAQQGFQLHFSAQPGMPELKADPDAIQQAILNLLTNAMKYSGDAREIDLRLAARNGDAVIEVEDHGLGMEPEEQKHVFEKFYRAPSHESRLIAGTGLGLTLVAHIAKAHGGRVQVESSPGAGSTFSILIPITTNNGVHA